MKAIQLAVSIFLLMALPFCGKNPADPPADINEERILFISASDNLGRSDLFTMNPDGSDVKRLTEDDYSYFEASWSPDLSRIVATGMPPALKRESWDIYILDSSGNHRYRLAGGGNPVWSPDGKQIAFENHAFGIYFGISIIDADGTDERKLNQDPYTIIHIWDWSKDGQRMLVTGEKYVEGSPWPESYELYEMDLNGNLIKQITDTKDIREYDAKWSGDENKIAFSTIGAYRDIYIMNSHSVDLKVITPSGENKLGHFRWSPDDLKIAFTWYGQCGRYDKFKEWANIYVINVDGTGLTQITFDDSTDIINEITNWR